MERFISYTLLVIVILIGITFLAGGILGAQSAVQETAGGALATGCFSFALLLRFDQYARSRK